MGFSLDQPGLIIADFNVVLRLFLAHIRLVSTIRSLGEEMKESYVVKKLIRAIPSKFLQIASTIEQFGDLENMSVEEAD